MGDNSINLKKMIKIYKPNGIDWMNFTLSRRNPYTFHHIISRSDGGDDTIENGAILTRRAHDLLHILEYVCPEVYEKLKELFIKINVSRKAPDVEIKKEIEEILHDIFDGSTYETTIDIDLSEFSNIYYGNKKYRMKKLRK